MKITNFLYSANKLDSYKEPAAKKLSKKAKSSAIVTPKDSVEISSGMDSKRLSEIKQRITSGFYSSSAVRSDLSEKLTNVLDEMTD
jgi:anti-sigma28 factor (negative regulator of flagellin synthesis)